MKAKIQFSYASLFLLLGIIPFAAAINGVPPEGPCVCNKVHECYRAELCTCRKPLDDSEGCLCTEPGNPFWATCDSDTKCCPKGDDDPWARHLKSAQSSLKSDKEYYRSTIDRCGDFDYDTHIYVKDHLYAIASPKEKAVAEGCPYFVTHAVFGDDVDPNSPAKKEILVWKDKHQGEVLFSEKSILAGLLHMGIFKLSRLAEAVEKADPSPGGAYDIVTNNCGSYMINLASKLGVMIDANVASFVARRLLEKSGKALADRIRRSMNLLSLFHGRHLRSESVGDNELVHLLVESHASRLY